MKQLRRSTHIYCIKCRTSAETYDNPICWKCSSKIFITFTLR